MKLLILRLAAASALAACGPTNVNIAPVKIQPIHMTIDVNLHDASKQQQQQQQQQPQK